MDIFLVILRSILVFIAVLLCVIYVVLQFWQTLPKNNINFKLYEYIIFFIVAFFWGVGLNNYWGLSAFLPLIIIKFIAWLFIKKENFINKGTWMEVQWQRMTPRGFNIPANMASEISRLPSDAHILIPRPILMLAVKLFLKSIKKNLSNPKKINNALSQQVKGRENEALNMIDGMVNKVTELSSGKTERFTLPFGLLKISRI